MKKTAQLYIVLRTLEHYLINNSVPEIYTAQIAETTGLLSGTLYPIMHRIVEEGWLSRREEEGNPRELKRPLRVYYRLTERGKTELPAEVRAIPLHIKAVLG